MMRQARGARAQLLRLQAPRGKLARPADTAPPIPRHSSEPTPAEQYALANPSKAALIRSLGRLPKKLVGDPAMTPDLVQAIVTSPSPILQALFKKPAHRLG
jgi:hypothetical protein